MCLVFLALNRHERFPFILAANRDEFHDRSAAPAHFWNKWPDVIAGQDLGIRSMPPGTWLGMTRQGRIALITNYRDPMNIRAQARSRGELVSRFLTDPDTTTESFLKTLRDTGEDYNGFNLVFGNTSGLTWYSNHSRTPQHLTTGIFGLSNALLDSPWPKVDQGKERMHALLMKADPEPEEFFTLLADDTVYADHLLPETGVGIARERQLSSSFIRMDGYGTRCSTMIMCDKHGNVQFRERTFAPLTGAAQEADYRFQINPNGQTV